MFQEEINLKFIYEMDKVYAWLYDTSSYYAIYIPNIPLQ